jgi:hypothetical protein
MKELTPFTTNRSIVTSAVEIDPEKAVEIIPMVRYGLLLPGAPSNPSALNLSPNHQPTVKPVTEQEKEEVAPPADDDPKVSSVIDSASPSPSDTVENGPNATDLTVPIHPSTLSEVQEILASAEKETTEPLLPPMTTG